MKTAITVATLAFLAIVNTPAIAESGHMDMKHGAGMSHDAGQPMAKMSEGTVKKVDKAARSPSRTVPWKTSICRA
jgi:hypothetical protein